MFVSKPAGGASFVMKAFHMDFKLELEGSAIYATKG
jgi:hypothetical protein